MQKTALILIVCVVLTMCAACTKTDQKADQEQKNTETLEVTDEDKEASEMEGAVQEEKEEQATGTSETNSVPEQTIALKAKTSIVHSFANVSVHDPSVVEVDGTYYIFGSHLAGAKSTDLMNWTLIDSGVSKTNKIIPDAMTEMEEAFTWAKTRTFWAPDVIQLADGRFYMYYCNCEGSSPLAALGIAVSDNVEGPYEDLGIILKSGMTDIYSENGDKYDGTVHPNVVDPDVFYDKDNRLWMMYGSYSGGIYILELNTETGFPLESGYGTKLLGANHLRIEASFIQYSEETGYYYMFLSYGGLAKDGGYNIRVSRSKNPDGPYVDSAGNDMIMCRGSSGSFFDDAAAEKYGVKLFGNFEWKSMEGEEEATQPGYVSPGHNSTTYDEESGKYFLIFHTRFVGRGENHEVRVHQMFLNEDGWFVVAPYRYAEETIGAYTEAHIAGSYKVINHQHDITAEVRSSENVVLNADHTVTGDWVGAWELKGDNTCILTVNDTIYKGVFLEQWDENGLKNVMTFTVLSESGVSIWGSGYEAKE